MKHQSLRRRLAVILLTLTVATWCVAVAMTAMYAAQTVNRQIDRLLTHYTDLVEHTFLSIQSDRQTRNYFRAQSRQISSEPELTRLRGFGSGGKDQATNLWFGRNQYLVGESAPVFPFPTAEGPVNRRMEQVVWRINYRFVPEYNVWLAVGLNLDNIRQLGVVSWWRAILPLVLLLPFILGIIFWGITSGLRPLRSLAGSITARSPQALNPIDVEGVPREILPVVYSLNELLGKLNRGLASEKRFTSNAAHELQTPLAAIQTEVQRSQREFQDEKTREMLTRIFVRVNRATETVRQLLTLARLDPEQDFEKEMVDLGELLIDEIAELGNLAIERKIKFGFDGLSSPKIVRGNREWLRILVRNLLLNALTHSVPDSEVEVIFTSGTRGVTLSIANDCKTLPEPEFERLTDRFYRRAETSDPGVGLGLSIVQRIADLHGAQLQLFSRRNKKGFVAQVLFSCGSGADGQKAP